MAYEPFKSALWQPIVTTFLPLEPKGVWRTLLDEYEDGAARYRAHAVRQTVEGKLDHAACSLRKAEHKDRMAERHRKFLRGLREW